MELRTLRYFLALAQEGTVSNAAKALHVTQPTLSRQLADLERGFGKQLFERGAKRIVLTDEGVRLREYAEAIVELADKAEAELAQPERAVAGDVYVGCGESDAMRIILRAAKRARDEQALKAGIMQAWAGEAFDSWDVVATYNLVFNGALMVEEGLGSAICYDGLVKTVPGGPLCFRPLDPPLSSNIDVVWKKHRRLSKAAETFLGCLQEECG